MKFRTLILVLAVSLAWTARGEAGEEINGTNGPGAGKSLTGLFAVHPRMDFEEYERIGLDREDLRTYTGLALQKAGLSVLSDAEAEAIAQSQGGLRAPSLFAGIEISDTESGMVLVRIEISLSQEVRLIRDAALTVYAPTWSARKSYVVSSVDIEKIRDWYKSHLDAFLEAYRTANP